jgi:fermentation-respiration switch protein FrsA (DUF1100 family)
MLQEIPTVFVSQGIPLIGRIYRSNADLSARQPAVVVTGSWLTVKEQMAALYARRLAERGYTAFTFDFAGWGESGGVLRNAEIPTSKIVDLQSAARFIATQSFVDPARIAYLGICASAQYMLRALAADLPIRAFASVAGWYHDASSIAPFYAGAEGVALRMRRAAEALDRYVRSGELAFVPAYLPGNDRAGMHFELDYYAKPSRGAVASWPNKMAELSWSHWLSYDGVSGAARVDTPTLLVHSDDCALPDNAKRVYAALPAQKRLAWLDGSQQDYYDRPENVGAAVEQATAWFAEVMT